MQRVIVLIGVSKVSPFTPLRSVGGCIAAMRSWAQAQSDQPRIIEVTDLEGKPVTLSRITEQIFALNDQAATEQIIVYFAGHGLTGASGDLWLLTDAPRDKTAAVSLDESRSDALKSSFEHVVFISDACRSAAQGLQAVRLPGQSIFPNSAAVPGRQSRQVDQFFASTVGEPALEAKLGQGFVSIYTAALTQALSGSVSNLLEAETPGKPTPVVIRSWPLAIHLPVAVGSWLESNHLDLSQPTDVVIGSRPTSWLAEFDRLPPAVPDTPPPPAPGDQPKHIDPHLPSAAARLPHVPVNASTALRNDLLREAHQEEPSDQRSLDVSEAEGLGARFETHCGFRVLGSNHIAGAWSTPQCDFQPGDLSGEIRIASGRPLGVVLQFESGDGVLLPALPGFVGYMRFDGAGLLQSVLYEPSANNRAVVLAMAPRWGWPHWKVFSRRAPSVRYGRGVLNSAAARGQLRMGSLGGVGQGELLKNISYPGGVDLTSAILAAYGLYGSQDQKIIPELIRRVSTTYRYVPVDLLMLGSSDGKERPLRGSRVPGPPFPMLTRGWSLLKSLRRDLPRDLEGLGSHLTESLWTMVDAEGVRMLRSYVVRPRYRYIVSPTSEEERGGTTYA